MQIIQLITLTNDLNSGIITSIEPATLSLTSVRMRNPAGLFYNRGLTMYQYPKPFLSVSQLIEKLTTLGMEIPYYDEAEEAFTTIGYYRLRGYFYHQFDQANNRYKEGTNLNAVLNLYRFDTEMAHLIFEYLSQIEVALRVRFVNAFQPMQDSLILSDPSAFKNKKNYWNNQGAIAHEITRSNDVFIAHNFDNHDGAIPLWASVEIMSFGTLSKLIKNLQTGQRSAFSCIAQNYQYKNASGNLVTPSQDMLTSWIQAVSAMRNICAHNSRIYNRAINTIPKLISSDIITPQPRYNGLYQMLLAMKYLRPTDQHWIEFVNEFKELLNTYNGVYEMNRMNFPADWETHFQV